MGERKKRKEKKNAKSLRQGGVPRFFQHTFVQALIVIAMGAAIAAVIVLRPSRHELVDPNVLNGPAPYDIRVTHDFSIVREDATDLAERRQEAANAVLPVWDYETSLVDEAGNNIRRAFEFMRTQFRQEAERELERLRVSDGTGLSMEGTGSPEEGTGFEIVEHVTEYGELLAVLPDSERERLSLGLSGDLIERLRVTLSSSTLRTLGRTGFSFETEVILQQLVTEMLSHPLVWDREVLVREDQGIILRTYRSARHIQEDLVTDFSDVIGRNEIPTRLQEEAVDIIPEDMDNDLRLALLGAAREIIEANFNVREDPIEFEARRQQARRDIEPRITTAHYREGQILLLRGQEVTEDAYYVLRIMEQTGVQAEEQHTNQVVVGGVIYVLLIVVSVIAYGVRFIRRFSPTFKDLALLTTTLLVMVVLTKLIVMFAGVIADTNTTFPAASIYAIIPFAAGAMLVRLVTNAESALIFSIVFSLLVAMILPEEPVFAAYSLVGSLAGMGAVEVVTTRMSIFRAGLLVSGVNVAFGVATALIDSSLISTKTLWLSGFALSGGLSVAILVTALLPVVESAFRYITDIKLLELANPNHPALRDLLLRAPGSYHHSMTVGSLAEAACKVIGANALMARVGAYYHDIGKAKNPQYFAENQRNKNPHDKLKPHMSALIIKSHVKDGVDYAQQYGLPKEITLFIKEHHGTSLIRYFYRKAKELEEPQIEEVDEADFKYSGPKPQTAETAICLLADGIEAASRSVQDATQSRLQGLVQRLINSAFSSGQLDQCDLTLRDLDAIAREFIRILVSIHHQRPVYPGQKADGTVPHKNQQPQVEEPTDGGSDTDQANGREDDAESDQPEGEGTPTLRRLGIDKGGTVDPPDRRS